MTDKGYSVLYEPNSLMALVTALQQNSSILKPWDKTLEPSQLNTFVMFNTDTVSDNKLEHHDICLLQALINVFNGYASKRQPSFKVSLLSDPQENIVLILPLKRMELFCTKLMNLASKLGLFNVDKITLDSIIGIFRDDILKLENDEKSTPPDARRLED